MTSAERDSRADPAIIEAAGTSSVKGGYWKDGTMGILNEKETASWRETYDWKWIGVLRFPPTVSLNDAIRTFERFVATAESIERWPLSWVLAYSVSSNGISPRIRVLMAGARVTSVEFANAWWDGKRAKVKFLEFDLISPDVRRALREIETSPAKNVMFILRSEHLNLAA